MVPQTNGNPRSGAVRHGGAEVLTGNQVQSTPEKGQVMNQWFHEVSQKGGIFIPLDC